MDISAEGISKRLSMRSRKARGGVNMDVGDLSHRLSKTRTTRAIAVPQNPDLHLDGLRSKIAGRKGAAKLKR
jgi:hypothetical protein